LVSARSSAATVKTRLSRVYDELGVANRTALATFASVQIAIRAS
jgi:DNA-binding NarL/FixJ family response regulator